MAKTRSIIPAERIDQSIVLIRGQKVMLDADLATLYGVTTKALNQAVKRNLDRFPEDFMFQLTWAEAEDLKSQIVTLKGSVVVGSRSQTVTLKRGSNVKYRPCAFTEQGVAMLSSVLKSKRAVRVNLEIMRAFVRLRQVLATHESLARKLDDLEAKVGRHDEQFAVVIRAIRELMEPPPEPPRKRIGFATETQRSLRPQLAQSSRRGDQREEISRRAAEAAEMQPVFSAISAFATANLRSLREHQFFSGCEEIER